jgi:hypothetical protein
MYNVTLTTLTILQAIQGRFPTSNRMFQTPKTTYIYILIYQGKLPTLQGDLRSKKPASSKVRREKKSHFSQKGGDFRRQVSGCSHSSCSVSVILFAASFWAACQFLGSSCVPWVVYGEDGTESLIMVVVMVRGKRTRVVRNRLWIHSI